MKPFSYCWFTILFMLFSLHCNGEGKRMLLTSDIDLRGKVMKFPENTTLVGSGGKIKNGTVIGNHTKIEWSKAVFSNVTVKGTWNVPKISTAMFADLKGVNALKNVFALADAGVRNEILIAKGTYTVKALRAYDKCLEVPSNTSVVINGNIRILPNNYVGYAILFVKGENIAISGSGTIMGDKFTHTGKDGEWGMGVRFHEARDASVRGLTIKDCWGDCIYVGGKSKNILIEKCALDNGRRQGISVTKADGVTIRQCKITNVSGTAPEYGIDLEPNKGDTVQNVIVENVDIKDCMGGILVFRMSDTEDAKPWAWVERVQIRNCDVSAIQEYPIRLVNCSNVLINGCKLATPDANPAVHADKVDGISVTNNAITLKNSVLFRAKNEVRKLAGKKDVSPISIMQSDEQKVSGNKIIDN